MFVLGTGVSSGAQKDTIRVLFIGNSYTHFNRMVQTVQELGQSVNVPVYAQKVAVGGWFLKQHAASSHTIDAIKQGRWDYVVLQEQSLAMAWEYEYLQKQVMPSVVKLDSIVRKYNTEGKVLLYMTWGRNNDSFDNMQKRITAAYTSVADSIGCECIPVGLAFERVRKERPELSIYQSDDSHPTHIGSYLIANMFLSYFTSKQYVSHCYGRLIQEDALYLQRVAQEVTKNWKRDRTFPLLGHLKPKSVADTRNHLTIGCEVLDRDYADYEQYKKYLAPLGMRKIRLQAGWAKTEKVKGHYDFRWLDTIIDDALGRGLEIWLEVSYGNPIYQGGGTPFLKGGWPVSEEGKTGWNNWVRALAQHYKGRVHEWEIWNEPDINKELGKDYESLAELNIRTAEIIKEVDPKAKIAALALALITDTTLTENCLKEFKKRGKLDLFDWISYHQYMFRPEDMYPLVERLRTVVGKYSSHIKLWQGESGAPSRGRMGGALSAYDWTETSQAKWALRRILGDHGRDIATGIFCISDMNYAATDAIKKKNVKGLLQTDDEKRVIRPKMAYFAVQNLMSVFDLFNYRLDAEKISLNRDYSCSKFLYETEKDGLQSCLLWWDDSTPFNFNAPIPTEVRVKSGKFECPVIVDILSGTVKKIPEDKITKKGKEYIFSGIQIYDSPILITDKSLIQFDK